jgi:Fe-S cluster biogenesis protein NfuA
MDNLKNQVSDILKNLNWLLESHDSFVELISIQGNKVIIHCEGYCSECETNCIVVAFRERLPQVKLVFQ